MTLSTDIVYTAPKEALLLWVTFLVNEAKANATKAVGTDDDFFARQARDGCISNAHDVTREDCEDSIAYCSAMCFHNAVCACNSAARVNEPCSTEIEQYYLSVLVETIEDLKEVKVCEDVQSAAVKCSQCNVQLVETVTATKEGSLAQSECPLCGDRCVRFFSV